MMKLEMIFSSVVLAILIIMLAMSMGYPPKARLFPLIIIIATAVLAGIQMIKEVLKKLKQGGALTEKKIADEVVLSRYLRAPTWIGTFILFIYFLGYLVGSSLFSLLYLKLHGEKWVTTILFALGGFMETKLLAGPILRRTTKHRVCVWLATSEPMSLQLPKTLLF